MSITIIVMVIAGIVVGFALDAAIARLAKEPYERGELEDDDLRLRKGGGTGLELHSETGALALPRALTSASIYRRAAIVALTTLLFALVGRQYAGSVWQLAVISAYTCALVICAATDAIAYRVPNVVTYPAVLGALVVGLLAPDASRFDVIAGGVLAGGLLFIPSLLTGGAMGMGDVKLALFMGFALGLALVIPAMLLMAIGGGLFAVFMLVTRIRGRRDPIPYAPFIAGATMLVMLLYGTAFAAV